MSDRKDNPIDGSLEDLEGMPSLTEAPPNVDSTLASEIGLFSEKELTASMRKVSALEVFLSATVKDCSFSDFIHEILISVMQVIKSEAGSVFEFNPNNDSLFFRAVVGSSSDRVVNFMVPLGQGIVGHVAEARAPLIVDNVPENTIHLKSIERVVGFETRNLVAFPILIRGKLYGVLELMNRVGEENYTPEDVERLTYLCNMAAKAIEIRLMIAWTRQEQKVHREAA